MKLLAIILASSALALVVYAKSLDRFEEHHIVPDLINAPPKDELKIKYASGAEVKYGNILTPTMVKELPKKLEWDYDSKSLTTLIMIDPDAPSRRDPFRGEVLHWLVVNIPKGDFKVNVCLFHFRRGTYQNSHSLSVERRHSCRVHWLGSTKWNRAAPLHNARLQATKQVRK